MAERTVRVCDWQDDLPGAETCGRNAPYEATVQVGDVALAGDLCEEHRGALFNFLRNTAGLKVEATKVDGKPRNSYITSEGAIVSTRDIRTWALAGKRNGVSTHGRLPRELIQEFLDTH